MAQKLKQEMTEYYTALANKLIMFDPLDRPILVEDLEEEDDEKSVAEGERKTIDQGTKRKEMLEIIQNQLKPIDSKKVSAPLN